MKNLCYYAKSTLKLQLHYRKPSGMKKPQRTYMACSSIDYYCGEDIRVLRNELRTYIELLYMCF